MTYPSPCDFCSVLFKFPGYLKPSLLKYHQLLQLVSNCQPIFRGITRLPASPRLERGFNALLNHWQGGSPSCCHEEPTTQLLLAAHPSSQHWAPCRSSHQAARPQHCKRLCFAPAVSPHSIGTWDFPFPVGSCEGLCPAGKLWGKGLLLFKSDSGIEVYVAPSPLLPYPLLWELPVK